MIRHPRSRPPHGPESGFVLIGVIMFVLALTILGISLFSLSSIEAQFLGRTVERQQAFLAARGGIERARWALMNFERLEAAKDNLPPNVTATSAVQAGEDEGPVDWEGEPVLITATAQVGNAIHSVQAQYVPSKAETNYKRLITTSNDEPVNIDVFTGLGRNRTLSLVGEVVQADLDTAWKAKLRLPPFPIRKGLVVDRPGVGPFIQGLLDESGKVRNRSASSTDQVIKLWEGVGQPVNFFTTDNPGVLSFYSTAVNPTIQIHNPSIWLLPRGVRFDHRVVVEGRDPSDLLNACLVIVAGEGNHLDDPSAGIWFFGGLTSTIPVILVSDGRVILEQFNQPEETNLIPQLTIFSHGVRLSGGTALTASTLAHPPLGTMDLFINRLIADEALPNITTGTGRQLTLIPGTWTDAQP